MRYVVGGLAVLCDMELPDLATSGFADHELTVSFDLDATNRAFEDGLWLHGPESVSGVLVKGTNRLVIAASPQSCSIAGWHIRQLAPIASSALGHLVLHASSADLDGRSVLFVGESGRGKSTLAAAFDRCGYRLLSDDLSPVRFNPVPQSPNDNRLQPIAHVLFIEERGGTDLALVALDEAEAFDRHLRNGFGEHGLPAAWRTQFDQCHRLVLSADHWSLRLPDDGSKLDDMVHQLAERFTPRGS